MPASAPKPATASSASEVSTVPAGCSEDRGAAGAQGRPSAPHMWARRPPTCSQPRHAPRPPRRPGPSPGPCTAR
eukprot:15455101-Alexandrium_andersonii.AAC.1